MTKLLATDLDGTLLKNNIMSLENKNSLHNLKTSKNLLVISTGRPYNGVKDLIQKNNIDVDYNILLNGALIIDSKGCILLNKTIPYFIAKEIVELLEKEKVDISIETGFTTYTLNNTSDDLPYEDKVQISSLSQIETEELSLISLYFKDNNEERIESICSYINNTYYDICTAFRNVNYIDIVPTGCSKGNAVKFVCSHENLSVDNIYTIGDSFNDLSMFEITKNSFTFYHCNEILKKNTNYLVNSVAECVNNYILKNI